MVWHFNKVFLCIVIGVVKPKPNQFLTNETNQSISNNSKTKTKVILLPDSFQHSIENFFSYKLLDNHYIFITKQSACRQDRNGRHDERVNFSRCNGESHSKIMAQFLFSLCQRHPSLKEKLLERQAVWFCWQSCSLHTVSRQ